VAVEIEAAGPERDQSIAEALRLQGLTNMPAPGTPGGRYSTESSAARWLVMTLGATGLVVRSSTGMGAHLASVSTKPSRKEPSGRKLTEWVKGATYADAVSAACLRALRGTPSDSSKTMSTAAPRPSPEGWSAHEKLRTVADAGTLSGEALSTYLREKGLPEAMLRSWREAVFRALAATNVSSP